MKSFFFGLLIASIIFSVQISQGTKSEHLSVDDLNRPEHIFKAELLSKRFEKYKSDRTIGMNFLKPEDDFRFSQLKSAVETKDLRSIEETLGFIKENYPNSLKKYVLMYKSRSLQGASMNNPRVLALAGSKKMVFTFNGHSTQKGYNNLEIMDFDDQKNRFNFFEISFQKGKSANISEANPAKCMNCHQAGWRKQPEQNDPRPNWEPYNVWPGALGSLDGEHDLFMPVRESDELNNPRDRHLLEAFVLEPQMLLNFEDVIKVNHKRYSYLGPMRGSRQILQFTKVLAAWNSRRLARIITSQKDLYEKVRYTLASVVNDNCEFNYTDHGGPKVDQRFYQVKIKSPLADELRDIFEPFGIRTEDWPMNFRTDGHLAADGKDKLKNPASAHTYLAYGLKYYDQELFEPIFEGMNKSYYSSDKPSLKPICEETTEKHFERIPELERLRSEISLNPALKVSKIERPLIGRCMSCHSQGSADYFYGDTPYIPFDDVSTLKKDLEKKGYPRGSLRKEILYRVGEHALSEERMPKGVLPSEKNLGDFVNFIENL